MPGKNKSYDVKMEFPDGTDIAINFEKIKNKPTSHAIMFDSNSDMNPIDIFTENEITEAIDFASEHLKHFK